MINQSRGILRIGTSGIVVPGSKQSFPAEFQLKSRLNYYGSLFNTLEVNSTFQKIPMLSTLEKWALDVPEEFRFTLKLWREITHVKQLNIDLKNINTFFSTANYIGNKKGCLLVQFPGSITTGYSNQVEQIFIRLHKLDHENQWRKAIEFRSETWYSSQTYDLLDRFDASVVLHDMPKSKNFVLNEAAKFIYFRFHGPKGDYRGSYSTEFLEEQAEKIRNGLNEGKDVYVYFNNTMINAFENAMSLKTMVEK
ncbi:MAG: DUF72 domain-containing protein [Segetibacter sp.]